MGGRGETGVVAVVVAALLMASCTSSRYMGRVLTPEDEATIRRQAPRSDLVTTLPRGHEFPAEGRIVSVSPAVTLVDLPDGQATFQNQDIERIRVRDRLRGAGEGAALGAASGAVAGALMTATVCGNDCLDADLNAGVVLIGAAAFAVVGGLIGLIVGGARGHTTTYWYGSFAR